MANGEQTVKPTYIDSPGARPTIGYLAPTISDGTGVRVWSGMVDAAREHNVNLICFVGQSLRHTGPSLPSNVLYDLASAEHFDGLISWASSIGSYIDRDENLAFHQRYRAMPIVTMGAALEGITCVLVDSYQGMREAMLHLLDVHGYRRVAFIRGPQASPVAEGRHQAYLDVLQERGLFDPNLVIPPGDWSNARGAEAVKALLDQRQLRPKVDVDAIATASDLLALGALAELQARGIKIPGDIAVVGFNDSPECKTVTPPLTSVVAPFYTQGEQAVETLLAQIAGRPVPPEVNLPARLVVRQSCGCVDPAVTRAAVGPVKAAGEAFESALAAQRADILLALEQAAGDSSSGVRSNWAERLFDSFTAELKTGSSGVFLQNLDEVLRSAITMGRPVSSWQDVVSELRRHMLPYLDGEMLSRATDLCEQSRVVIGAVSERAQAYQAAQAEQQAQRLQEIGAALITTFDMKTLMDVLAQNLPRLDIPSCYLALYEDPPPYKYLAPVPEWSRLVLAFNEKGRVELEPGGQRFRSRELAPEGLLPRSRQYSLVVEPLYFEGNQLGFIVLETGPQNGAVYEALQAQISSALQGALLVQRVQERSSELARQQYILDTFMENVPDRIYFKDSQGRITKANRAHTLRLGLSDPAEEIGKSDFDFFPQDQAQRKYEQEQQIISTGHPVSLEEKNVRPDGQVDWSLTTKMPLRDEHGNIIGTFGISRDITDLVKTKEAAEAAKNEADQARQEAEAEQRGAEAAKEEADQARKAAEAEKQRAEAAKEEADRARKDTEAANQTLAAQMWQTAGQAQLNERVRGEQDIPTLASNVIQNLCRYLNAQVGALYVMEDNVLQVAGTYAYRRKNLADQFQLGEGLVGQAALERQAIVVHVPDDYIAACTQTITSMSLGEMLPRDVLVAPLVYDGQTIGVVEVGALVQFTPAQIEFIQKALESVAVAFTTAQARARINQLLSKTQQQAEELRVQEEELRATNEELEAQTESLRSSEAELRVKQSDLEAANAELEEKAQALERSSAALRKQQAALDKQNQELLAAKQELERKAQELALASRYKSEFLANMSHELRTPLNSLLILAGMLAKNEQGNLTPDQVESAQIIYSGGADLLNLINEILDLSKVEAGRMEFRFSPMSLARLVSTMRLQFTHVAESKDIEFKITLAEDMPDAIVTDQQRVEQIVKNLLSNAFKFTEKGHVHLSIYRPRSEVDLSKSGLDPAHAVAISVTDTGIGMTPEQQRIVFEAFQQADGSTSRQYGGTGLGLTISRELATRLGGQIDLASEFGKGSTFTLYLPFKQSHATEPEGNAGTTVAHPPARERPAPPSTPVAPPRPEVPSLPDDRDNLRPDDRVLLVIEDDDKFAKVVYDFAHKKGWKCLVAGDGETGLKLVKQHKANAIVLDLNLPRMSGWQVLDTLKTDPDTRHIPVHIMSVADENLDAYKRGAMGFLTKPATPEELDDAFQDIQEFGNRKIKSLLIVEDDENSRKSIRKLLEGSDVTISEAGLGHTALERLASQHFDCMILDLTLPDMSGFELLGRMHGNETMPKCPVIVYTGKALTEEENRELLKYADSVIVKGVKSPERLLDETALFLHRVIANLPEDKQRTIRQLHDREAVLVDKQILVVDDDARNAFALSKLLADKGLKVHIAPNGQKALELLDQTPVDLVLMDIMLPGMDGYEVTKRIRDLPRFRHLPILALTAKAMKGDHEKCIAAGASDYLSKPVDAERLFSMLRVWLSKE